MWSQLRKHDLYNLNPIETENLNIKKKNATKNLRQKPDNDTKLVVEKDTQTIPAETPEVGFLASVLFPFVFMWNSFFEILIFQVLLYFRHHSYL